MAVFVPNPNRNQHVKIDVTPAYVDMNTYPENKSFTPHQLREKKRQMEEQFRMEKENKIKEAKMAAKKSPSNLPVSGMGDLVWTKSAIEEKTSLLEKEFNNINEDIVVENVNDEASPIPSPGEYCIVHNGDILFSSIELEEIKGYIINIMDKNPSANLDDYIVMKRLKVAFELQVGE